MLQRCRNQNHRAYEYYGGREIKVCKRWESFENFFADMGDPPPGTSLDRIDNDADYTPDNCRSATAKEQANNKRKNRVIELNGEMLTLAQLAEMMGALPTVGRNTRTSTKFTA